MRRDSRHSGDVIRIGDKGLCYCKGFQPWAVRANSLLSRVMSCAPKASWVM